MTKAVFFDFDGVISDSKKVHENSWIEAVKHILDVKINKLPHHEISGKSPRLIAKTLCDLFNKKNKHEALLNFKNNYLNDNLHLIKPFSGVEDMFKLLKAKNIYFGIASNASKFYVSKCLKNWNFEVDVCYGYEDYENPKPHPEPYLKLASFFKIESNNFNNILVFEDSETGLLSAINANMKTIYIKSDCAVSITTKNTVNYYYESVLAAQELFE